MLGTLELLTTLLSPDLQALAFLAWSVPLALAMLVRLASPERFARIAPTPSGARLFGGVARG